jgi:hypothetical protein
MFKFFRNMWLRYQYKRQMKKHIAELRKRDPFIY